MPCLIIYLLFQMAVIVCNGQQPVDSYTEFDNQKGGLMYADSTMRTLRHMVDSLNIRHKTCDINPSFNSCIQGNIWTVSFSSQKSSLKDIREDIIHQVDFSALIAKYNGFVNKMDTLKTVIQLPLKSLDDEEGEGPEFLVGNPNDGYSIDYNLKVKKGSTDYGKWRFVFSPKDKYDSMNRLYCYYFPESLSQKSIPNDYARLLSYVDCMIDTGTVISLAGKHDIFNKKNQSIPEFLALNGFLNRKMNLTRKKDEFEYAYLTENKVSYALTKLRDEPAFKNLVERTADALIVYEAGSDELEELIAVFVSPKKALEVKRHRNVFGRCSQDQSPRIHARNIAVLAAETNSWDIFLRAHLDIMNDRFTRMSDGSYAYCGRKTYLRELEVLNLDVVDLILGLALRAENAADNHYNGTIWRLGWAISESKDKELFESRIVQMMKDPRLDEFNRGLLFLLYKTYLYSLKEDVISKEKLDHLRNDANNYPPKLRAAIGLLKDRKPGDDND